MLKSRWILKAALLIALLTLPVTGMARGKLYAHHGNQKFSRKSLSVGQARNSVAMSVAKRLNVPRSGFMVKPSQIKVSIKMAPDGKTAVWRASVKPRRGSAYDKLGKHFGTQVKSQMYGTINVGLRAPTQNQIRTKAFELYKARKSGNAKSDWVAAEKQLTKFGNKPRTSTIRKLAFKMYQGRQKGTARSDWFKAQKMLTRDLNGGRVKFINNSKAYNNTLRSMFFPGARKQLLAISY